MKHLLLLLLFITGLAQATPGHRPEELNLIYGEGDEPEYIRVYCKQGHCIRTDTGEPIDMGDQNIKDGYYAAFPVEELKQEYPDLVVPEFVPGLKLPK